MRTRNKAIIGILMGCLLVAAGIWHEVRTCRRMRAAVEQALEMNRTFQPFTSDTIQLEETGETVTLREAVAYYNHPLRRFLSRHSSFIIHHSSLTKSLYALGCVYRDLHEAPIAIITWEDAVAAADTTAADCDYATLFRVYGQMAEMYFRQYMPEKELVTLENYSHFALLSSDTLNYIKGLLRRNSAYLSLGDTAAVFDNIEYVRHLYLERGLTHEAAQVYPSAIHIALDRGEYEKADSMMQIFEKESGLFDEHGNIESTREIYYYHKGTYYLETNLLDSAEVLFRRLLRYESNLIDAYRGLIRLYEQKNLSDSIYKYAILYEGALGDYFKNTKTYSIAQAQGMYDYSRQEQIAQEEKHKKDVFKLALILVLTSGFILALLVIWTFRKKKKEKRELLTRYNETLKTLSRTKQEVQILQHSLSKDNSIKKLLKDKEDLIEQLESTVTSLQKQIEVNHGIVLSQKIEESGIVQHFHTIAQNHFINDGETTKKECPREASSEEWEKMAQMVQHTHPSFYLFIVKHKLSTLKFRVCILSYLGFDNHEIMVLTSANKGSVPNARTALAKELFALNSARELDDHLHQIDPLSK